MATVEFLKDIKEEICEIKLRKGKDTGNRIIMFIFEKVNAMEKMRSFSAGADYMLLNDEEGDIQVTPRKLEFFYKNDDNLARAECTFELVNDMQWQRLRRFLDRYAESNGMGYEAKGEQPAEKMDK